MRHATVVSVFVAALVTFSGCSALSDLTESSTDSPVFTPAAVPTDRPTPTPAAQLAPGLTKNGVTNPAALAQAHNAVLNDTSFTRISSHETTSGGDLLWRSTTHIRVAAFQKRYYEVTNWTHTTKITGFRLRNDNLPQYVEQWYRNGRLLTMTIHNNSTSYRRQDVRVVMSPGVQFRGLFSPVETRVLGRETRNGTTLYRVQSTRLVNTSGFPDNFTNPRNFTFRALIDSRGFAHEYRLAYTVTVNGQPIRINRTTRYANVGSTTVERPLWYEEAMNRTTPTD